MCWVRTGLHALGGGADKMFCLYTQLHCSLDMQYKSRFRALLVERLELQHIILEWCGELQCDVTGEPAMFVNGTTETSTVQ